METRWGKRFGRYEVVAELGRGAMGVVYKARDPKIDRFVAVKTVSLAAHNPEEQKEYRERFFREAQAAGRLLHPGIVTIFDVGEDADSDGPYLVMEYVAGVSLNSMLVEGAPIPLESALRLTQQIAEALDCAHAQGIVHRDIKPANILVTAGGQAKITDFGVAKLNLTSLTIPGRVFGTPAYMSPEQLEGGTVDGRADIFALGVILYSMVTGYRPFQGSSVMTVCFKVANREPLAATLLHPELPRELDAVIARAIAKNPADRYQRGMEMAMDLGELLEADHAPAQQPPATTRRRDQTRASDAEHHFASALWTHAKKLSASKASVLCIGLAALALGLWWPLRSGTNARQTPRVDAMTAPDGALGSLPPASPSLTAASTPNSTLALEIDHPFKEGKISVWVDGSLEYSHVLRGEEKKRLLILHKAHGRLSQKISIAPGQRRVGVRVQSQADAYDQRREVLCRLAPGAQKTLRISLAGPHEGLQLRVQ
jgi:serine/threonine protein kinase